jgi:hypothetical protein
MMRKGIFTVLICSVLLPANESLSAPEVLEVVPVARYVSDAKKLRAYQEFKKSVIKGTAVYDSTFRHPFLPLGSVLVDCRKVRRIGVTLALRFTDVHSRSVGHRYPTSTIKDTPVRYVWSHSEHDETGGRYLWKTRLHPHYKLTFVSTGLNLRDVDYVDGTVTVNVFVNAASVYETSFRLVGCEAD